MKKILITGALGQIGSELVVYMRDIYGSSNVVASDKVMKNFPKVIEPGPFEIVDVLRPEQIAEIVKKYNVDTIIHLAAILSAIGESNPALAWNVNMGGLFNVLEVAREIKCMVFTPSSIAAFGPSTPKKNTPQVTLQRPTTMYGITKTSGELLCDYYFQKFGVDTRGVRFPGLISHETLPGGGTTDYAVHIYYDAVRYGRYTCYIKEGTYMDMMYMPDALNSVVSLAEAGSSKLIHRNAFNITAMSIAPEHIFNEIKKHIHGFVMDYDVDPVRQGIAESWPDFIDDSAAREEWGWKPKYDLSSMTVDMLENLRNKL